ncbi:MAG: hypothetical protein Q8Q85_03225 [Gemmatimonadales bacterium]|nr:hypothetical protein [Gemmatimonadales bacterium]
MTIVGLPILNPSTPRREAMRAALVASLAFLGMVGWALAEAALPLRDGPLTVFTYGVPGIGPRAWGMDPSDWHGLAAIPSRLVPSVGAYAAIRILGVVLISAAALAVIHPGVLQRPRQYFLPPLRRVVAYASAVIIGVGAPEAMSRLGAALTPDITFNTNVDIGAALRIGAVFVVFCASLWLIAGPGVLNIRAYLRFGHGAVAGLSMWGACCLGVLLAEPLRALGELAAVGNVLATLDASRGAPGGTYGWILLSTILTYGLAMGMAGALAVVGAPQSLGPKSRGGAGAAAAAVLGRVLLAGWRTSAGSRQRVSEAAPDVVESLGLSVSGPARPIVLLMGAEDARRRVPARQALLPRSLAADCAPSPAYADRPLPAASEANLAALDRWLGAHHDEVSALAARAVGCRVAILARLFRTEDARTQIFGDAAPALVGAFAFRLGLKGIETFSGDPAAAAWVRALRDTARYAATADWREKLERLAAGPPAVTAPEVRGRLAAPDPAAWRVALVTGAEPGTDPWLLAPRTDGLALQNIVRTATPSALGDFTFRDVPAGRFQLALLAPEGTAPERLRGLSVAGDPGQFIVAAASRRDLGTIRISY